MAKSSKYALQLRTHKSGPEARPDLVPKLYYMSGVEALDMCLTRPADHRSQKTLFLSLRRAQVPRSCPVLVQSIISQEILNTRLVLEGTMLYGDPITPRLS